MSEQQVEKIGYWTIVWEQFRKNKLSMFGLYMVLAMVILAIYAPFISLNKPIYISSANGWEFPFFRALFDRNFFENGVDIFFNLQIFLFPLLIFYTLFMLYKRNTPFFEFFPRDLMIYFCLSLVALGLCYKFEHKEPFRDYKKEILELEMQGKLNSVLWPLRDLSYRQTSTTGRHPAAPDSSNHLFGTDKEGRDIFARMVYGTRISLTIGLVAVSIYIAIGIVLGSLAGFFGGWVDLAISRFIEIMLCFPTFFLILTLSALIQDKTIFHVMIIIGLTRWPEVARLVRAEFLKLKSMDYVQAAVALGFSKSRVIFLHVLPNAMGPVIVTAVFGVASSILIESSLSFLGLGDVTAPSWGEILSQGRQEYKLWLILFPGFAIFMVVSIFNLVGEGLQDAMDPKQRR